MIHGIESVLLVQIVTIVWLVNVLHQEMKNHIVLSALVNYLPRDVPHAPSQ